MADESFFARWARLKAAEARKEARKADPREAERAPESPPPALDEEGTPSSAPPAAAEPSAEPAPFDPATLPPVESLTASSDFKPFLQAGVPEELKQAALRQLWRSDPVLAVPEVLDLHNLDYTMPAVPEVVRTAYRVGKGFLDAAEAAEEKLSAAEPSPAPPPSEAERAEPPSDADAVDQPEDGRGKGDTAG